MALVGSVVTKNMEENHLYAGSPAKDITAKAGTQFKSVTIDEKYDKMIKYLDTTLLDVSQIAIVKSAELFNFEDNVSYFDVSSRTYTKKRSAEEVKFMKFLLPAKGKFTPALSNET